jgi:hypothetical protein
MAMQRFVIIGAVAAMLMAMAGWDRFWTANVIYLCFVLSAILGSITKIIAYRRSVPRRCGRPIPGCGRMT